MEPQLIVIDTEAGLDLLSAYLTDKDLVAYDCETTGLSVKDEVIGFSICAEEEYAYYVVLAKWDSPTNKLQYTGLKDRSTDLIASLLTKKIICHNAIFDCKMAEAFFKVRLIDSLFTDTMILAHLLNENRRVGLKELAADLFGDDSANEQKEMKESVAANGGTLTKDAYQMYKADYMLMGKYGAKDALLTYKLFLALVPELYEQGLEAFFYEEESMPLLKGPTYDLNTTGLQVDLKRLQSLKTQLEAECLEARSFIYAEIQNTIKDKYPGTAKKNTFNIGSSSQLSWLIFGQLGLEFNTLTKEGKIVCKALMNRLPYTYKAKKDFIDLCLSAVGNVYQPECKTLKGIKRAKKYKAPWSYIACDKKTLKKLASKHRWIDRLLEFQRKTKLLNTYVEGIESRTQYGIIHPSFLQHGTTSGRYSSRDPNWQNLPRDDKRIKECIVARPGKVFVGADQSQLEPRIFSYYSEDPRLMAAFDGTSDFYSVVGMEVYDKTDCTPQKEGSPNAFGVKYKHLRDLSKTIALARAYGATAHQLAPTVGKSVEDTQQDMDNYDERFPGVLKMMLDAHELAKKDGYVSSLFGRRRRIPEAKRINKIYGKIPHPELPYEARSLLNLACNHRIQSTGASIMNRAAIKFYNNAKEAEIDCKIVCQVHDSLIIECDKADAEDISVLLQYALENTTTLKGITFEAVPKIGVNFAEV